MKILWDELKNYQPVPVCHYGGMKAWMDYQQQKYVMQILMGLNESYTSTRGQILMSDPLSPMAKVFNLVVQEQRQRSIGSRSSAPSDSMAFNASSPAPSVATASSHNKPRRDRPICTHCGLIGHTVDRYYKLHGFPPGYKPKGKAQT